MHQSTTPSLSQTIWPRWASKQFRSLLIVQTLLPVTFGYSLSSQAVVMRQLRWKRLYESHWHAHTRGLTWVLTEVVGTAQQEHYSRRRLLRRGLEFHVFTVNKLPVVYWLLSEDMDTAKKTWTRLMAFHIALIPWGKVWIQIISLQLWVNSRAFRILQPWWGN